MRSSIQVCEWYISSFHPEKLPLFDILALFFEVLPGDVSDLVGVPGWPSTSGFMSAIFSKKNESYIDWQVQSFLGSPILTRYDISYLWRLSNCHAIHFSGKSEGVRKGTEDKYRWCNQWSFFRFCRETILNRVVVSMWETHPIRTPAALQPIARQCASSMRSLLLVFLWSSAGSIDLILTWLQWGKLMQSHSGNKYRLLNIERERYM